jgi:hypothetical protein
MGRDSISLMSLDLDTLLRFICRLQIEVNMGMDLIRKKWSRLNKNFLAK